MKEEVSEIKTELEKKLEQVAGPDSLNSLKVEYLGKKGRITSLLKALRELPPSERPEAGKLVNELKVWAQRRFEEYFEILRKNLQKERFRRERVDITLPGRAPDLGAFHPVATVMNEIISVFTRMGFEVAEGPDIEDDYHNFQALNIPPEHPARDMQDTFYLDRENYLLRTHTSPVQIRVMEKQKPPIHIIAPGKVYRRDADLTHTPMFHQVEGLLVDTDVTFADLKGTLTLFAREIFGPDTKVRFRPSFFPFTEPSVEMDIQCVICGGKGCRVCQFSGWLEILGAGMVDPEVFKYVGIDPEKFQGFAFGMGVERIAMLKYRIDDIRLLFENNLRFLSQFK